MKPAVVLSVTANVLVIRGFSLHPVRHIRLSGPDKEQEE